MVEKKKRLEDDASSGLLSNLSPIGGAGSGRVKADRGVKGSQISSSGRFNF